MPPVTSPGTVLTRLALAKKSQPAPESIRCQKCLQSGHWTYQCTNAAKYVVRQSRTSEMKKQIKENEEVLKIEKLKQLVSDKRRRESPSSSSSSSSDSDSDSSFSSSESDSKRARKRKSKIVPKRSSSPSSSSSSSSSDTAEEADGEGEQQRNVTGKG